MRCVVVVVGVGVLIKASVVVVVICICAGVALGFIEDNCFADIVEILQTASTDVRSGALGAACHV